MQRLSHFGIIRISPYEAYVDCTVLEVSPSFVKFFGKEKEKNIEVVKVIPHTLPAFYSGDEELGTTIPDIELLPVGEYFRWIALSYRKWEPHGWKLYKSCTISANSPTTKTISFEGYVYSKGIWSEEKHCQLSEYSEINLTKVHPQDFSKDLVGIVGVENLKVGESI